MCWSGLVLCCKSQRLGVGAVSGEPPSSPAWSETVECSSVTRGGAVRGGEPFVGTHRGGERRPGVVAASPALSVSSMDGCSKFGGPASAAACCRLPS